MSENQTGNIVEDVTNEQSKVSEAVENEAVSAEEVTALQEETVSENIKPTKTKWWQKVLPEKERAFAFSFLGALSALFLPYLLKTVAVLIVKRPLSSFADVAFNVFGVVLAFLFLALMEKECAIFELKAYAKSVLYVLVAYTFSDLFFNNLYKIILLRMVNKQFLFWVIYAIAVIIIAVFLAMALPSKGKFVKKMLMGILLLGVYEIGVTVLGVVYLVCEESFLMTTLFLIAVSLLVSWLIKTFILKNKSDLLKPPSNKSFILPGVLLLLFFVFNAYFSFSVTPQATIISEIYSGMEEATIDMMAGNYDLALKIFQNGLEKRRYWYSLCGEQGYEDINTKDVKDIQISLVSWEKENDVASMEAYLLNENYSIDVGMHYLNACAKNKEVPNETLRKKIVNDMVSCDSFVIDTISYEDIEGKEARIRDELDKLKDFEKYEKILPIVIQVDTYGIDEDSIIEMLELAEEYPEDMYLQAMAVEYGTLYQKDHVRFYEKTGEAIVRYKKLYEEQYGYDEAFTNEMLNNLYTIKQFTVLISLVKEESNPSLVEKQYLALAYIKVADYKNGLDTAIGLLEQNPNDYIALYCKSYCQYKNGAVTESISTARELAEQISKLEGKERNLVEDELFVLIENYTMYDSVFSHPIWELDDEQRSIIESNDILNNYYYVCYCFYEGYSKDSYETAMNYLKELETLLGNSPTVYYLEGNVYTELGEYQKAIEVYFKSLAIDNEAISTWLALANAYDALGDYENAYLASLKGNELLPYSDHDNDVYGAAYHNNELLESLSRKIKEN